MNYRYRFNELLESIDRPGIEELKKWLDATDFYEAPASTIYHNACRGGLLQHSVNVAECLMKLADFYCPEKYSLDSILIVSLFHDLCKVNFYESYLRNVKNEFTGQWEKVPSYRVKEETPMGGHGSKSMYIVMSFLQLSDYEASAINAHMGQFDSSIYSNPSAVYEWNELAWLLHVADERASYLMEGKHK